jgi:hypothetical protein
MIFTGDQWARLDAMADVVSSDGNAPMAAATVEGALARGTAILGQTDLPAERIVRAPQLRAVIDLDLIFRGLPPARLQSARRQTVSLMSSKPGRTYSEREVKRTPL